MFSTLRVISLILVLLIAAFVETRAQPSGSNCKVIDVEKKKPDGGVERFKHTYCRNSDGNWERYDPEWERNNPNWDRTRGNNPPPPPPPPPQPAAARPDPAQPTVLSGLAEQCRNANAAATTESDYAGVVKVCRQSLTTQFMAKDAKAQVSLIVATIHERGLDGTIDLPRARYLYRTLVKEDVRFAEGFKRVNSLAVRAAVPFAHQMDAAIAAGDQASAIRAFFKATALDPEHAVRVARAIDGGKIRPKAITGVTGSKVDDVRWAYHRAAEYGSEEGLKWATRDQEARREAFLATKPARDKDCAERRYTEYRRGGILVGPSIKDQYEICLSHFSHDLQKLQLELQEEWRRMSPVNLQ